MSRAINIFIAMFAVFAGSLLSDVMFGDGIQTDDINQAMIVAGIAGMVQYWLTRKQTQQE